MKKTFAIAFTSLVGLLLSSCSFINALFGKKSNPTLESIKVLSLPTKSSYVEKETFDPNGLVLSATYSDLSNKFVSYKGNEADFTFTLSLNKPLELSDKTIGVTYKEKEAYFDIEVVKVEEIDKTNLIYTYDDYTKNNYYTVDNCPLEGNPKLLIIPIWFNDSDNFIATSKKAGVRNDIEKAYSGTASETGWHSVKSFYESESKNKITLSSTVTDWYSVNSSYLDYGPYEKVNETIKLVKKASDAYFSDHPLDSRSNYDSNNDGYLDGVMLIYGAPDYDSLGDERYKNLWAYCNWAQTSSSLTTPAANVFFWASYDFMYGSNAIERSGTRYGRGFTENGIKVDAHCFIHEMGHVFGLEDYYDYSDYGYTPAGGFSMQDYNVGGHDPYSVISYGWASPFIPKETMTISIGDFQSTHDVILLTNHSVINSPFDEYLLLEYYTPTLLNEFDSTYQYQNRYPQGSKVPGIRLWHVDARLYSYKKYKTTTNPGDGYVIHLMTNSYGGDYTSPLGEDYNNFNILQLIRNDENSTFTPTDTFNKDSLFKVGDSFDMTSYSKQFVNGTKMNDNTTLGWSFKVVSLNENNAIITVTKN